RRVIDSEVERVEWPAESGGAAGLEQILERARALIANPKLIERPPDPAPHHSLTGCDFALYRLLSPERERQQRGILAALERVVDLVAWASAAAAGRLLAGLTRRGQVGEGRAERA